MFFQHAAWHEEGLRTGWEDLGLGGAPLALQPGGTDGSPLHGGACHGQMGTVSGPPRRYDRGGATQLFLRRGSGDTPLLEMPRGVGVHRLTPQPGHGRAPLSDGAHHGRMGTVSGPPRRHDRGGATHRDRCEVRMASQHASINEDLMATQAPTSGGHGGRPVLPPSSPSQTSQTCVSVPR